MSQTSESGTVQVKRFAPEVDTSSFSALLIIAATALFVSLVVAQIELYAFYKYILFFKTGG